MIELDLSLMRALGFERPESGRLSMLEVLVI
jgi:hypothetical protein